MLNNRFEFLKQHRTPREDGNVTLRADSFKSKEEIKVQKSASKLKRAICSHNESIADRITVLRRRGITLIDKTVVGEWKMGKFVVHENEIKEKSGVDGAIVKKDWEALLG